MTCGAKPDTGNPRNVTNLSAALESMRFWRFEIVVVTKLRCNTLKVCVSGSKHRVAK